MAIPAPRVCLHRVRAGPHWPRRGFSGGGGLPGPSSRDGGLQELPEFRDNRCSNRASFAARASLASTNSDSCPGIPDLPIPRRQLPGLLGQLPGLVHDDQELVARHRLRPGHRKIKPQAGRSIAQRHASNIRHPSITHDQLMGECLPSFGLGDPDRKRQISFFDSIDPARNDLRLLRAGIILRLRRKTDGPGKSTLKLRPGLAELLVGDFRAGAGRFGKRYSVEYDWARKQVLAASMDAEVDHHVGDIIVHEPAEGQCHVA